LNGLSTVAKTYDVNKSLPNGVLSIIVGAAGDLYGEGIAVAF
jgi:hypothetical protein